MTGENSKGIYDYIEYYDRRSDFMNKMIDARGLSCPEPVIMIRKAMASNESEYEMVVDNIASKENVTRYATHQGYSVDVTEQSGEYTLKIKK